MFDFFKNMLAPKTEAQQGKDALQEQAEARLKAADPATQALIHKLDTMRDASREMKDWDGDIVKGAMMGNTVGHRLRLATLLRRKADQQPELMERARMELASTFIEQAKTASHTQVWPEAMDLLMRDVETTGDLFLTDALASAIQGAKLSANRQVREGAHVRQGIEILKARTQAVLDAVDEGASGELPVEMRDEILKHSGFVPFEKKFDS